MVNIYFSTMFNFTITFIADVLDVFQMRDNIMYLMNDT